ncbi:MAG TPA: TIGR01777 family oxidoreductase [Thermoanaerobaculia bacterium]|nr:TIGR01777 family oxidoreductase [Thermoanaerobaculia bacterium]
MKIILPGGSGHLGSLLTRAFRAKGHDVLVLTRDRDKPGILWDGRTLGPWATLFDGADAVINLAGRSVDCRYNARNRDAILRSRLDSTRVVGEAIAAVPNPPKVWLQSSTATIYAHRFDKDNDEYFGLLGGDEPNAPDTWRFSIDVAKAWEQAFDAAKTPATRKVKMRTAIVMTNEPGSTFTMLRGLASLGLCRFGDGRQYVSWIHERDYVRAIDWLIAHENVDGVVNVAAPHPLPNEEFMDAIRRALGVPLHIPVPAPLIELGALALRTESELVLKSRRVAPRRLRELGFPFEFPRWGAAARDLCDTRAARMTEAVSLW